MEFEAFPKIGRMNRDCTITEKIDGTNAQLLFDEVGTRVPGGCLDEPEKQRLAS